MKSQSLLKNFFSRPYSKTGCTEAPRPAHASSSSKNAGPSLRACVGDKPRCLIRARTKGRHFGDRPTSSVKREMKAACRLCDLSVRPAMFFSRRWMLCRRKRIRKAAHPTSIVKHEIKAMTPETYSKSNPLYIERITHDKGGDTATDSKAAFLN